MRLWLAGLLLVPAVASAQGTLGGQGFGYPAGQLSARASALAGSIAPFDPMSPVNPAAVSGWVHSALFFHLEPETRTTTLGGAKSSTNVSRFPLIGGAARLSPHAAIAITFSTYLDRTWETVTNSEEHFGQDSVALATNYASSGAINDLRAAFAWSFSDAFQVGAAFHAYTGENRLNISWDFPDSVPFGDVKETSTLSYDGSGISLGAQWRPVKHLQLAAYGRTGGPARMHTGDTLIARGNMPQHTGLGLKYDGSAGTVISASWERIDWTKMRGLGSATLDVRDADRMAVGIESPGPMIAHRQLFLRAGASQRTLPFAALGSQVKENTVAAGAGIVLARGLDSRGQLVNLANLDIGVQRQQRRAGDGRETAWLWNFGFTISP